VLKRPEVNRYGVIVHVPKTQEPFILSRGSEAVVGVISDAYFFMCR
jgi:hypothetical protein